MKISAVLQAVVTSLHYFQVALHKFLFLATGLPHRKKGKENRAGRRGAQFEKHKPGFA